MKKELIWPLCWFILGVGVTAVVWFAFEGLDKASYLHADTWHTAALLGSLLVVVGWIVTSANTLRHNELDRTLKILDRYAFDPERTKRWTIINNYKPSTNVLKPPGPRADYPSDHEIYDAVWNEINSCEYIAIGGVNGIYDDAMIKNEFEDDFLRLHHFAQDYIKWTQQDLKDAEIWENFDKLCRRWLSERKRMRQRDDLLSAYVILAMAAIADACFVYLRWRN